MKRDRKGQAILEYILMVIMLAVTVAVVIRNSNRTIYLFWTGLARQIAIPCPDCTSPAAPDIRN
jgi:Flp pilus assembly pilin Flp